MGAIKKINGISADTYDRLAYDSGAVYVNYGEAGERLIGATRGGNTFVIETEYREMTVDGAPGPVKGAQRILREIPKLTVNLIELTKANMQLNLPGSSVATGVDYDVITGRSQIASGDYFTNVTLILEKAGSDDPFIFKLKNAISLSNFEIGAAEDDETVMVVEFTGHFDPAALTASPYEISNPLDTGATLYTINYVAGANGSVIGDTTQIITSGGNGTAVYANPDSGYQFVEWDEDSSTDNPRTDTGVVANATYTATFAVI